MLGMPWVIERETVAPTPYECPQCHKVGFGPMISKPYCTTTCEEIALGRGSYARRKN